MAEQRKLLFFTLNYYWMDKEAFLNSREAIALLRTHEELAPGEYSHKISYRTFLIDLSKSREALFSALDYKSARYTINRALKAGVVVRVARDPAEKRGFYEFYQRFLAEPQRQNQVLPLRESELERLVVLYATSAQGEYLGGVGLLPSPDGRYLLYKYAATLHRCCENDLLVWQGILYAKEMGFSYFDMSWMIPGEETESKQYRLYQYKKKFGGELVDFYSFVKLRGGLKLPGLVFTWILKHLFADDINNLTLCLKRLGLFK